MGTLAGVVLRFCKVQRQCSEALVGRRSCGFYASPPAVAYHTPFVGFPTSWSLDRCNQNNGSRNDPTGSRCFWAWPGTHRGERAWHRLQFEGCFFHARGFQPLPGPKKYAKRQPARLCWVIMLHTLGVQVLISNLIIFVSQGAFTKRR